VEVVGAAASKGKVAASGAGAVLGGAGDAKDLGPTPAAWQGAGTR